MLLSPRYDPPPVLVVDGVPGDPAALMVGQRRRLSRLLATLTDEQWAAPSRCAEWSVKDVVTHLVSTNQFWTMSIAAGLAGTPTRFLETFDPVASPAALVDGLRHVPPAEALVRFDSTLEALADACSALDDESLELLGESPPGHVALRAVLGHALWDSWTHERDIALPLGLQPAEDPDEIAFCLRYAAAIGPTLAATNGSTRTGTLEVVARDPDVRFVVEAGAAVRVHDGPASPGAACLAGSAVDLVEGLTFRAPLEADLADEDRWLVAGLDEVFDLA